MKINGQEHPEPNATLGDVMRILSDREAEHAIAKDALKYAERSEFAARTALDVAQRDFDKIVSAIKDKAPSGSHWQRKKIEPAEVLS